MSVLPGQMVDVPVTVQPSGSAWDKTTDDDMVIEESGNLGLKEFSTLDKLQVQQQMTSILGGCCGGYEGENEFEIGDKFGKRILSAKEESNYCGRQCCPQQRGLRLDIKDRDDKLAIVAKRPLRCDNCICCPCCNQVVTVECPPGSPAGSIRQSPSCFVPTFEVLDVAGDTIYTIEGPHRCLCRFANRCCCCPAKKCLCFICGPADVEFDICSEKEGGKQVGKIDRKWQVMGAVVTADMDKFMVDFPNDADLRMKATLLCATFLIDYLFFEENSKMANGAAEVVAGRAK